MVNENEFSVIVLQWGVLWGGVENVSPVSWSRNYSCHVTEISTKELILEEWPFTSEHCNASLIQYKLLNVTPTGSGGSFGKGIWQLALRVHGFESRYCPPPLHGEESEKKDPPTLATKWLVASLRWIYGSHCRLDNACSQDQGDGDWKPEQTSPEVRIRSISDSTKMIKAIKILKKEEIWSFASKFNKDMTNLCAEVLASFLHFAEPQT